jgi:ribosomal protein S18 acetylase RimI-like enzyme
MHITTATPAEWSAAFELALEHLPADVRSVRVLNALALLAGGDIDPEGIFVAQNAVGLGGVAICVLLPGASGLFWLPRTVPADPALEDQLVDRALDWLRGRGAKLAQAFVSPLDRPYARSLLRRGFQRVTRLNYLEHLLRAMPSPPSHQIRYVTYSETNQHAFHATLLRTYEATLDCPELNGARTIQEIIAGHLSQGDHRPERWWLALAENRPVAVAMATVIPDLQAWDLSYLGVVPEARRQGVARALAGHVLRAAQRAQAPKLILAVDERNLPALQLYGQLGFTSVDFREVYLQILDRSLAARFPVDSSLL